MTREEHLLMVSMFTQQMLAMRGIVNILMSRGLAEHDDWRASVIAGMLDRQTWEGVDRDTEEAYSTIAKTLGVDTGLSDSP